ncbi:MAG: hypothetical protein RL095_4061 [Verrucomicrobiota bacterium]|jgi:16S rRNA (guanine966-N2)-methyltransferase
MRIIAGAARGIPLEIGPNPLVRPTTDRIKETVFNMIGPLDGLHVADLYAGSGALGLEALSRGAASLVMVENDRATCAVIQKNLAKVLKSIGAAAADRRAEVVQGDAAEPWRRIGLPQKKLDLILADPPYADSCAAAAALLQSRELANWAGAGCRLVLEHLGDLALPEAGPWRLVRRKDFRPTCFTFWESVP